MFFNSPTIIFKGPIRRLQPVRAAARGTDGLTDGQQRHRGGGGQEGGRGAMTMFGADDEEDEAADRSSLGRMMSLRSAPPPSDHSSSSFSSSPSSDHISSPSPRQSLFMFIVVVDKNNNDDQLINISLSPSLCSFGVVLYVCVKLPAAERNICETSGRDKGKKRLINIGMGGRRVEETKRRMQQPPKNVTTNSNGLHPPPASSSSAYSASVSSAFAPSPLPFWLLPSFSQSVAAAAASLSSFAASSVVATSAFHSHLLQYPLVGNSQWLFPPTTPTVPPPLNGCHGTFPCANGANASVSPFPPPSSSSSAFASPSLSSATLSASNNEFVDRIGESARNRFGRPYISGRPLLLCDRQKIIKMYREGRRKIAIAREIGVTHSCVSKVIRRFEETGMLESKNSRTASCACPGDAEGHDPRICRHARFVHFAASSSSTQLPSYEMNKMAPNRKPIIRSDLPKKFSIEWFLIT
ncbi:hypothetical protein niasHT_035816 [Heterodera trifolii]|uniref:Paired domain-containing protein n=1 Tax=Heterodera trifolii TaxID=157864 RepID=A0ABD2HY94_9BILA